MEHLAIDSNHHRVTNYQTADRKHNIRSTGAAVGLETEISIADHRQVSYHRYPVETKPLMETGVRLYGQLEKWPSKTEMARLLTTAGFSVYVGQYSIRLKDCEHFVIQEYGGDLGDPHFDADASTLERMIEDGGRVSRALESADIRHRFKVYNDKDELVGYLHHQWPQESQ